MPTEYSKFTDDGAFLYEVSASTDGSVMVTRWHSGRVTYSRPEVFGMTAEGELTFIWVTFDPACQHCERPLDYDLSDETWVDLEATGDDAIWRETCDANDTERAAPHAPIIHTEA